MEDLIVPFFVILTLLGVVLAIVLGAVQFIRFWITDNILSIPHLSPNGLNKEGRIILEKNFPYYNQLNSAKKLEFEKRLKYFIQEKEFIPKGSHEITLEMKILIGASAVQLTFGYHPLKFTHFPKILLFPGRFYSKGSSKLRKGEVNFNGMIVLSWQDFIKDYKIEHDGINLGLHEMAHALKIEDGTPYGEYAFLDEAELDRFYEVGQDEFEKIRRGEKSFIRSYAGHNMEEFFAVSVEHFFEQPEEFKSKLPLLYASLSRLLNQDPAKNTPV